MNAVDTTPPAEFVPLDSELYNIRVVTKEGESYYKSYHYEQIRDFFILEHQLRKKELLTKILGGYGGFCNAFHQDEERRGLTAVSFATIRYEGLEPVSVAWNPGSRSPTVREVLGPDVDLRSRWEKMGSRLIMRDEVNLLRKMARK
ncbi:hypothetical protein SCLCIDRAFT_1216494 [Scleroderma citrinum Foug A]|uniref:Uncharacterized protein n=1 Tax=Scleroderma citrinum Foug A TaxID=1036808 RepID=A0A0C3DJB4_9AGAM|nr:hypothetical protein SCLCIDRAFT_1216494 [Scleroderma citrinum Foug A]